MTFLWDKSLKKLKENLKKIYIGMENPLHRLNNYHIRKLTMEI